MTWKHEAIEQIDAIFEWLLKVDKWDKLANRLSKLLLGKWNETQRKAIDNALELLNSGPVTKDALNDVLGSLERSLGKNLADAMREPVATVQTDSYHLAGKDIGVDFEFNRPDRKAMDWLERDAMYWIGTHYDRNLRRSMEDSAQEVIRQGMGRLEATAHLKSVFGERFGKADGYWEGLSNHIVTRAREFGRVSAYDQAGVKYFKVVAYLDHRTSSMCRAMNGRIISVDVARAQRDAMMAAKTPEDAKKVAPWYNDKEVKAKVEGKPSGKLPKAVGLPPYHFNCRTRTVYVESQEDEIKREETKISSKGIEHGILFDDRGEARFRKSGDKGSIGFSDAEFAQFKDNVLTHNHPSGNAIASLGFEFQGRSFSSQDVTTAIRGNLKEIRAVTPGATFILSRVGKKWSNNPSNLTNQSIQLVGDRLQSILQNEVVVQLEATSLTMEEKQSIFVHKGVELLVNELSGDFNWRYKRIVTEKNP